MEAPPAGSRSGTAWDIANDQKPGRKFLSGLWEPCLPLAAVAIPGVAIAGQRDGLARSLGKARLLSVRGQVFLSGRVMPASECRYVLINPPDRTARFSARVSLAEVRRLIHEADPDIVEDCKWIKPTNPSGVPEWSHAGVVCTGEASKQMVKRTFSRGASLDDPSRLFNSSLEGNTRRTSDVREGETLDAEAFKTLVRDAVAHNLRLGARKAKPPPKPPAKAKPSEEK